MNRLLIIEDDKMLAELEKEYLESEGYQVSLAYDGDSGIKMVKNEKYDLIVLDLMLPLINGLDVCSEIRETKDIPILIVTAKHGEKDKILGYKLGADDYLEKPFTPEMLVTRVEAQIRRYKRLTKQEMKVLQKGLVRIELESHRVFIRNEEIFLKNKEYELLLFFAENANIIFDRERLYERVWKEKNNGGSETVIVHINRLREKMGMDNQGNNFIQTVRGAGYIFRCRNEK